MAMENVLHCHTFHFVDDDFFSIKKYIENVFDDGDLGEVESASKSSNEECCQDVLESEIRATDLLGKNGGNTVESLADKTIIHSASHDVENESSKISIFQGELHKIPPKNDKVRFSLKIPRLSLLKLTQQCLEDPQSPQAKQNSANLWELAGSPPSKTLSDAKRSSPPARGDDNEQGMNSDHSSGRKRTSSSSLRRVSKNREVHARSRSGSRRRSHRSQNRRSEKYRCDLTEEGERQASRRRKRSSEDHCSKIHHAKLSKLQHRNSRSPSSESEWIIAAQSFANKSLEGQKKRPLSQENDGNKDKVTQENENKESGDEVFMDVVKSKCLEKDIQWNNSFVIEQESLNCRDVSINKDLGHFEQKDSLSASQNKAIESNTLDGNILLSEGELPLSENSLEFWDIDPLLINSIPTDEDVLIPHEKAVEFRTQKFATAHIKVGSNRTACRNSIQNASVVGLGEIGRRNVLDPVFIEHAIGSLETYEDVVLCCNLLLKQIKRLPTKPVFARCSKSEFFVNNLKVWLESKLSKRDGDAEIDNLIQSCGGLPCGSTSNRDRLSCSERSNIRHATSNSHSNGMLLPSSLSAKLHKRVSIVSPDSSSSESENNSRDLHAVERQIKMVLNPAIMNGIITKIQYKEIVELVVHELKQWREKISEFDCISFLQKSVRAVSGKRLF